MTGPPPASENPQVARAPMILESARVPATAVDLVPDLHRLAVIALRGRSPAAHELDPPRRGVHARLEIFEHGFGARAEHVPADFHWLHQSHLDIPLHGSSPFEAWP